MGQATVSQLLLLLICVTRTFATNCIALPKKPVGQNPCPDAAQRWYFNKQYGKCSRFETDCPDNDGNNWLSRDECELRCLYANRNPSITDTTDPQACLDELKEDDCVPHVSVGLTTRTWFYNKATGECQPCSYSGRRYVRNMFRSYEQCMNVCRDVPVQWKVRSCVICEGQYMECERPLSFDNDALCKCKSGYRRTADGANCEYYRNSYSSYLPTPSTIINGWPWTPRSEPMEVGVYECYKNNIKCDHGRCIQWNNHYQCECSSGYQHDPDRGCVPIPYVTPTPYRPITKGFTHTPTPYKTPVHPEYCRRASISCDYGTCFQYGSRYQCECIPGYRNDVYGTCVPDYVDSHVAVNQRECDLYNIRCDRDATCYRSGRSYTCKCNQGYQGDGFRCVKANFPSGSRVVDPYDCERAYNRRCHSDAECMFQFPTTNECRCRSGYTGDGFNCYRGYTQPYTPTYRPPHVTDFEVQDCRYKRCGQHASCRQDAISSYCQCAPGYAGNGETCVQDRSACTDNFDEYYRNQCGDYNFQKWFYFDRNSGQCRMFYYNFCTQSSSRNIFADEQSCVSICNGSPTKVPSFTYPNIYPTIYPIPPPTLPPNGRYIQTPRPRVVWPTPFPRIQFGLATVPSLFPSAPRIGELPSICNKPYEPGNCDQSLIMYYYNQEKACCQPFVYSGCGGNENMFSSLAYCQVACQNNPNGAVSVYGNQVCLMRLDQGRGRFDAHCQQRAKNMYYFNYQTQRCEQFFFYGCGGNSNLFYTEDECYRTCRPDVRYIEQPPYNGYRPFVTQPPYAGYQPYPSVQSPFKGFQQVVTAPPFKGFQPFVTVPPYKGVIYATPQPEHIPDYNVKGVVSPMEVSCTLPPDMGPCRNLAPKWYFDSRDNCCKEFTYGGCNGNGNRFESRSHCEQACKNADICNLPVEFGTCNDNVDKYFFDPSKGDCVPFYYTGCGGNANKFSTYEECKGVCGNYRRAKK